MGSILGLRVREFGSLFKGKQLQTGTVFLFEMGGCVCVSLCLCFQSCSEHWYALISMGSYKLHISRCFVTVKLFINKKDVSCAT